MNINQLKMQNALYNDEDRCPTLNRKHFETQKMIIEEYSREINEEKKGLYILHLYENELNVWYLLWSWDLIGGCHFLFKMASHL